MAKKLHQQPGCSDGTSNEEREETEEETDDEEDDEEEEEDSDTGRYPEWWDDPSVSSIAQEDWGAASTPSATTSMTTPFTAMTTTTASSLIAVKAQVAAVLGILIREVECAATRAANTDKAHQGVDNDAADDANQEVVRTFADFEGKKTRERLSVYVTSKPSETPKKIATILSKRHPELSHITVDNLVQMNPWFEMVPTTQLQRQTPLLYQADQYLDGLVIAQPQQKQQLLSPFWSVSYGSFGRTELVLEKTSAEVMSSCWKYQ
eukprot:COSAG05_NODE_6769_length_906_cov_0.890954_2_plen_263_part_01